MGGGNSKVPVHNGYWIAGHPTPDRYGAQSTGAPNAPDRPPIVVALGLEFFLGDLLQDDLIDGQLGNRLLEACVL
jgi:hypothetical protein